MSASQNKNRLALWVTGGGVLAAGLGFVKVMADRQERHCAAAVEKVRGLVAQGAWVEAQTELGVAADVCKTVRQPERASLGATVNEALGASAAPSGPALSPLAVCGPSAAQAKYVVKESGERADFMKAGKTVPRLTVRASVPRGLPRDELRANVCHALVTSLASAGVALGAVDVLAYSTEDVDGAFSAAKGTYAPEGDWAKADADIPQHQWQMTFEFASGYFEAKAPALAVGAAVVLAREGGGTVAVSKDPKNSTDEFIIARVPSKTRARVMDAKEFPLADGKTIVRYDIETVGAKQRGWVWAADVHRE